MEFNLTSLAIGIVITTLYFLALDLWKKQRARQNRLRLIPKEMEYESGSYKRLVN